MNWKVKDWCIFDLSIGQIKEIRDKKYATFTDGFFETSGMLVDRFRPLTLINKRIIETADCYYSKLRLIDGEVGFNYPAISQHFHSLSLIAIDNNAKIEEVYEKYKSFVKAANEYIPEIQGIKLFRPKLKCVE